MSAYSDYVDGLSPIAYWRLGESSGTVAVEEVASANGTYVNSPTLGEPGLVTSDANTAVAFNGTNQYVNAGTSLNTSIGSSDLSVAFLINLDSFSTTWRAVQNRGTGSTASDLPGIQISGDSGKINNTTIQTGAGDFVTFSGDNTVYMSTGVIHHIVITYDMSTAEFLFYLDGAEISSSAITGSPAGNTFISARNLTFASTDSATVTQLVDGTMDEVCMFNKVLTPSEISDLYDKSLNLGSSLYPATQSLTLTEYQAFVGSNNRYPATQALTLTEASAYVPVHTGYAKVVMDLNPLAYWRLGDLIGSSVAFEELRLYDGTYSGTPTLETTGLITGDSDTAVTFDATDTDILDLGSAIGDQGVRSIVLSINLTNDIVPFSSGRTILYRYSATGDNLNSYGLYINPSISNKLVFGRNIAGASYSISSDTDVDTAGTIYHIAATIDPTAGMALYIDGVKQTDTDASTGAVAAITASTYVGLEVRPTVGNSEALDGVVDDISFYDTALTQTEVSRLNNAFLDTLGIKYPATQDLTLTTYGAYLPYPVFPATQALTLTEYQANVPRPIVPTTQELVITEYQATITGTVPVPVFQGISLVYDTLVSASISFPSNSSIVSTLTFPYSFIQEVQANSLSMPYSLLDTDNVSQGITFPYAGGGVSSALIAPYAIESNVFMSATFPYSETAPVFKGITFPYSINGVAQVHNAVKLPYSILGDISTEIGLTIPSVALYATSGSTDVQLSGSSSPVLGEGGVPTTSFGGFGGLSPLATGSVTATADILSIDISTDEGSYLWQASVILGSLDSYAQISKGDEIALTLGGELYILIVDSKSINRDDPLGASFSLTAVSPIIRLTDVNVSPYTYTWATDILASEVAAYIAGMADITLTWDTVDWLIPADVLSITEGEPLTVLLNVADAVGAVVDSNADGSIVVRPTYPISTTGYIDGAEDHIYTDVDDNLSVIESSDLSVFYNSVEIGDTEISDTSDSIEFIPDEVDSLRGELRVYLYPWRSDVELLSNTLATGSLVYNGDHVSEVIDEHIEIADGGATLSKPIYELTTTVWESSDIGPLTFDQYKTSVSSSDVVNLYGLATVTYNTRYLSYLATGTNLGDFAQYILQDNGG